MRQHYLELTLLVSWSSWQQVLDSFQHFLIVFDSFRQFLKTIENYRKLSKNIEKCRKLSLVHISIVVDSFWHFLQNVKNYQTISMLKPVDKLRARKKIIFLFIFRRTFFLKKSPNSWVLLLLHLPAPPRSPHPDLSADPTQRCDAWLWVSFPPTCTAPRLPHPLPIAWWMLYALSHSVWSCAGPPLPTLSSSLGTAMNPQPIRGACRSCASRLSHESLPAVEVWPARAPTSRSKKGELPIDSVPYKSSLYRSHNE